MIGTFDPTTKPRVAVLTASAHYPMHDVDHDLTAQALMRAGFLHDVVSWDAAVDWSGFDLVVIRSTWDYTSQLDAFLDTLAHIHAVTRLVNPLDVVRWNVDKRYLADLSSAGIPVVPTHYVTPGDDPQTAIVEIATPLVVKPVVSAGAKHTLRHDHHHGAVAHAQHLLHDGHTIMVQPYLAQVNDRGETGLVYLDGAYSHAFRKAPILAGADGTPETTGDGVLVERITQRQASAEERALGDAVTAWLGERFGTLAYARVDVLPTPSGPVVLEVELVEPNLFFTMFPPAADRFAQLLFGRCR
jgi:glutathione synthase/RimK-type ligase-like ATP-grasp enzyme